MLLTKKFCILPILLISTIGCSFVSGLHQNNGTKQGTNISESSQGCKIKWWLSQSLFNKYLSKIDKGYQNYLDGRGELLVVSQSDYQSGFLTNSLLRAKMQKLLNEEQNEQNSALKNDALLVKNDYLKASKGFFSRKSGGCNFFTHTDVQTGKDGLFVDNTLAVKPLNYPWPDFDSLIKSGTRDDVNHWKNQLNDFSNEQKQLLLNDNYSHFVSANNTVNFSDINSIFQNINNHKSSSGDFTNNKKLVNVVTIIKGFNGFDIRGYVYQAKNGNYWVYMNIYGINIWVEPSNQTNNPDLNKGIIHAFFGIPIFTDAFASNFYNPKGYDGQTGYQDGDLCYWYPFVNTTLSISNDKTKMMFSSDGGVNVNMLMPLVGFSQLKADSILITVDGMDSSRVDAKKHFQIKGLSSLPEIKFSVSGKAGGFPMTVDISKWYDYFCQQSVLAYNPQTKAYLPDSTVSNNFDEEHTFFSANISIPGLLSSILITDYGVLTDPTTSAQISIVNANTNFITKSGQINGMSIPDPVLGYDFKNAEGENIGFMGFIYYGIDFDINQANSKNQKNFLPYTLPNYGGTISNNGGNLISGMPMSYIGSSITSSTQQHKWNFLPGKIFTFVIIGFFSIIFIYLFFDLHAKEIASRTKSKAIKISKNGLHWKPKKYLKSKFSPHSSNNDKDDANS